MMQTCHHSSIRGYTPLRELLVIGICIVFFTLMLLFNMFIKRKWLSALVNIIVIIALCNPITLFFSFFEIPEIAKQMLENMSGRIRKLNMELYQNNRFVIHK